jgi:hypothetical protein
MIRSQIEGRHEPEAHGVQHAIAGVLAKHVLAAKPAVQIKKQTKKLSRLTIHSVSHQHNLLFCKEKTRTTTTLD